MLEKQKHLGLSYLGLGLSPHNVAKLMLGAFIQRASTGSKHTHIMAHFAEHTRSQLFSPFMNPAYRFGCHPFNHQVKLQDSLNTCVAFFAAVLDE